MEKYKMEEITKKQKLEKAIKENNLEAYLEVLPTLVYGRVEHQVDVEKHTRYISIYLPGQEHPSVKSFDINESVLHISITIKVDFADYFKDNLLDSWTAKILEAYLKNPAEKLGLKITHEMHLQQGTIDFYIAEPFKKGQKIGWADTISIPLGSTIEQAKKKLSDKIFSVALNLQNNNKEV